MRERVIFSATSHYTREAGLLPRAAATGGAEDQYRGYFETDGAAQAVFVYERSTGEGTLYTGEVGWDTPVPVRDGALDDAHMARVLGRSGRAWLRACWEAATGQPGDDASE